MTGEEMIHKIECEKYYGPKETEHMEMVELWWLAVKVGVIVCGLLSIAGNVRELWQAFEGF